MCAKLFRIGLGINQFYDPLQDELTDLLSQRMREYNNFCSQCARELDGEMAWKKITFTGVGCGNIVQTLVLQFLQYLPELQDFGPWMIYQMEGVSKKQVSHPAPKRTRGE